VEAIVGGVQHLGPVDGDEHHAVGPALEEEVLVLGVVHGVGPPGGFGARRLAQGLVPPPRER
jgi:hypothetical protein